MSKIRQSTVYKILSKAKSKLINIYLQSVSHKKYPKLLAKLYNKKTGLTLDWNNLVTYREKMQWAKLYDTDPLKSKLTDKLLVRDWISEKIGDSYLIPLLGAWDSFDEINFDKLPNKFVLKTNNASGTNIIVTDKSKFNKLEAKKKINKWLKMNYALSNGFQMQYKDIKPKIIAEKYIENDNNELIDYKFLCFDGVPHYCWVDIGRFSDHRRNVYDIDWKLQNFRVKLKNTDFDIEKPANFAEMIRIATELSKGFSHVRVDLYNVNGKIYFGELTFTNGNGFDPIYPEEFDIHLGNLWNLPINK